MKFSFNGLVHILTFIRNLAQSVMNTDVGQLRSIGELNKALIELEEYEVPSIVNSIMTRVHSRSQLGSMKGGVLS